MKRSPSIVERLRRGRVRAIFLRLATVAMLAAGAVPARAQMFVTTGRDTLRGLPGIEVIVEELQSEMARGGLDAGSIREDAVRRLRSNGVVVYASQGENPSPAKPYLYLHVNALELPRGAGYAVAIHVQLRQMLRSEVTNSNIVNAMTWDAHNVVAVPAKGLSAVQEEIQDYIDLFIRDWLAVHDRPPTRN